MTVQAYAKINIGLQIVRKREDGYHDIDSIFHRVDLADSITFRKQERGITLSSSDMTLPTDDSNLCVAAASALFEITGYDGGVHIDLEKRIPYGAGLGGGSSDAAATLQTLVHLYELPVEQSVLQTVARSIGADVPFFLEEGSAYAKGTGDILTYFAFPLPYWILLVNPGIQISTPWAYSNFTFNPALPIVNLHKTLLENLDEPVVWVNKIRNDFEPVVFAEYEDVMRIKEILYRTGADFALMSGSGSTVYGLYSRESYAREAAEFMKKKHTVWLTPPNFTV